MVEVVFGEEIVEELQAGRGEFHRRAGRGEDWSHQLVPGQVEIVTVAEPEQRQLVRQAHFQPLGLLLTSSV